MSKARYVVAGLCLATVLAVHAESGDDAQTAIDEAKAAYEKADSVGGGWVETPKLIKKAEEAAAEGDEANASKYAEKAREEAEAAYAQAIDQKEHWAPPPYVR